MTYNANLGQRRLRARCVRTHTRSQHKTLSLTPGRLTSVAAENNFITSPISISNKKGRGDTAGRAAARTTHRHTRCVYTHTAGATEGKGTDTTTQSTCNPVQYSCNRSRLRSHCRVTKEETTGSGMGGPGGRGHFEVFFLRDAGDSGAAGCFYHHNRGSLNMALGIFHHHPPTPTPQQKEVCLISRPSF